LAHPWHHAVSSALKFGGKPEDYWALHSWFDDSKSDVPDFRHRALKHHSLGIFQAEQVFGPTILNAEGKHVPTRLVDEQHVREDCGGRIPTVADWLGCIRPQAWMGRAEKLSKALPHAQSAPADQRTGDD
jgi:hypothetical protein